MPHGQRILEVEGMGGQIMKISRIEIAIYTRPLHLTAQPVRYRISEETYFGDTYLQEATRVRRTKQINMMGEK